MGAEKKTLVLPGKEDMERYMPLIADLERSKSTLVTTAELKNSELEKGSFVFLGSSAHTLGLFGRRDHPAKGFTLDTRKNPLNSDQPMVMVSSSSTEETARIVHKLGHYGKYSYLYFTSWKIREKINTAAQKKEIKYCSKKQNVALFILSNPKQQEEKGAVKQQMILLCIPQGATEISNIA